MLRFDRPVLMWVTDRRKTDVALPELAATISAAGADLIQVREPDLDRLPLELLVRAIQSVARPETHIVLNSNLALARKLGVGVHLPEAGPTIQETREVLGPHALIGRSVHSPESARASAGAGYLIAGHVFATDSKPGLEPMGLENVAAIVRAAEVPVIAIGGITPDRVADVLAAGAAGVAVLGPLSKIDNAAETTRAYRTALEAATLPEPNIITATINGKPTELPAQTTVSAFLAGRELHERLVVVERNGDILKRASFPEVIIEEGDLLEIVHFVGGG